VQPRLGLLAPKSTSVPAASTRRSSSPNPLTLQGLSASIGSVGDAEDNALAVSIIRRLWLCWPVACGTV